MSSGSASLQPTYHGHVATTHDALALFEACLSGQLHHVPRRPHDRERSNLIRSGCVFIYEENASGIKRWTDGVPWSPSRILGNFLVYRELLKPFPPGEKKRATKRAKRSSKPGEPYPRSQVDDGSPTGNTYSSPTSPTPSTFKPTENFDRETERSLIGSLVDSYGFKEGGLVKKTMSVNVNGVHHHLVSYYKVEDVIAGNLETPSQSNALRFIKPRHELTTRQNFRAPLDELEEGLDGSMDPHRQAYGYGDRPGFDRRPMLGPQGYHHPQQHQPHGFGYPGVDHGYGAAHPHASAPANYAMQASTPTSGQQPQYYPHSAPPQGHVKTEDYGVYGTPGSYPSRYENLGHGLASQPSPSERGPQSMQQLSYPQQPLRPRPNGVETPNMMDVKGSTNHFNRSYYPTGAVRPETMHAQAPYADAPRWTPSTSRPEQLATYPTEKGGYWQMGGGVGQGHAHYPSPSATPQWGQHPTV
ncbi:MAG: hypothetical protein M1817_006553 [Caeruleum heppii]|nr:MAG: hypothetical protein M1817_006553 [Caeruleum heppii]